MIQGHCAECDINFTQDEGLDLGANFHTINSISDAGCRWIIDKHQLIVQMQVALNS